MPICPRRPRFGRLLDILPVLLLMFIFFGLAVYHYRRLDRTDVDMERAQAAAQDKLSAPPVTSNDWPQWRGPNRDGVSSENILNIWPTGGPKVLWEQKTGEGFASVAVARGRVFTIFQDGDNESVVSYDATSGKEYWRYSYPCRYQNFYGNGPRSTPAVDGELIYTVGATGLMHCLKAFSHQSGDDPVWKKDLLREFGAQPPEWGVAFSPLVDDQHVYIMPGGPNGNSLAALDKRTGAVAWKKHDDLVGYSSPIAATFPKIDLGTPVHAAIAGFSFPIAAAFYQERQILFLTGSRLIGVNPDTGAMRWDYPWLVQQQCNIATPIVEKNYVFLSSGYGKGCALLKIEWDGDEWKAPHVYKNNTRMKNHFSSSVRRGNHLFGFDDSMLTCMNFLTGKTAWKERGFEKGSVLVVGAQLIVYGANGKLALAEASPESYVETASFQFSAQSHSCWSAPVVSNGRLYVRDQEKLVCFDVKAAP